MHCSIQNAIQKRLRATQYVHHEEKRESDTKSRLGHATNKKTLQLLRKGIWKWRMRRIAHGVDPCEFYAHWLLSLFQESKSTLSPNMWHTHTTIYFSALHQCKLLSVLPQVNTPSIAATAVSRSKARCCRSISCVLIWERYNWQSFTDSSTAQRTFTLELYPKYYLFSPCDAVRKRG